MRSRSLLTVGAIAAACLVAPSSAVASLSECNSNHMCAWGNNDFRWKIAEQYHGQDPWLDPFNAEENDETDSWANRSATYTGCLAEHVDGEGDRLTMARASSDGNLAWFNSDMASSMRTKYGC